MNIERESLELSRGSIVEFDGARIEVMITESEIQSRVRELADAIYDDHHCEKPVAIGVLNGSFVFMSDLTKDLGKGNPNTFRPPMPVQVDFLRTSSYNNGDVSTGVNVSMLPKTDLEGRHVILVEDILDTGNTLSSLIELINAKNPATLDVCVLLNKPDRRVVNVDAKYIGFDIEDRFVVGVGLDHAQKHRNLPFVGVVIG